MTSHDVIVAAVEEKRKSLNMAHWRFAKIYLGISSQNYSELKAGRRKFSVSHLRALYGMGIPADVLLGASANGQGRVSSPTHSAA